MALGATVHRFDIELADSDRGVYETLALRVARHPSESEIFMIVRVLAYCIEYAEGIAFSKGGVSSVDEPAVSVCDLTGVRQVAIEVGAPSAARLHKMSKATPRVAVYTDRRLDVLRRSMAGERIHRGESILVTAFPEEFLGELEQTLGRTTRWSVSINDAHLYVTAGERSIDLALAPQPLVI